MSKKKTDREAAAAAEERIAQAALAEAEELHEYESAKMRAEIAQAIAEEKQLRARDRLEAETTRLTEYRDVAVAAAVSNKTVAPQFIRLINGTSYAQVDQQIEEAKAATAEILAEVGAAQARHPASQARDELGRFAAEQAPADQHAPAGITESEYAQAQDGTLSLEAYAQMRDRLGLGHRDAGLFR